MIPALGDTLLILVGGLCDNGCKARFSANTATVTLQGNIILQGFRSPATRGLWMMELPAQHLTNNAINFSASASQLVAFAHAALFSPALSMLQRALDKNFLPPFPGLTAQTLQKHPPHIRRHCQGPSGQRTQEPTQHKNPNEGPTAGSA